MKSRLQGLYSSGKRAGDGRRPFMLSALFLVGIAFAFTAGCATPPKVEEAVFFPSPPDLPRIKFLKSYVGEKDLGVRSAFDEFVIGRQAGARLDKPYGVAMYDGKIYVCDTNATVMVFDIKDKRVRPLKGAQGQGKLLQPINISIEQDGTKYVSDPVRGQVVIFGRDDSYIGAVGDTPGAWKPVDAAAFDDKLYVADAKNALIKVFDKKTGAFIKQFGKETDKGVGLGLPTNLAFDKEGYLYVSDSTWFEVRKFDRDGHLLSSVGGLGTQSGNFARPRGVAVDREERLYVVDAGFNNVQVFNKDGQLLLFFGKGGIGPGDLYLPAKVFIDYDNVRYFQQYASDFDIEYLVIVSSQFEKRLVSVYAFGKQKGVKYPSDEELLRELKERMKKSPEATPAKDAGGKGQ